MSLEIFDPTVPPVKEMFSDGRSVVVQSGLGVGERIVYSGQSMLSDGAKVNVVDVGN